MANYDYLDQPPLSSRERQTKLIYAIRLASMNRPDYLTPETDDFTEEGMVNYLSAILVKEFQYLDAETLAKIVRIVGRNYGWSDPCLNSLLGNLPCGRYFRPVPTRDHVFMGWALNMAVRKKVTSSHALEARIRQDGPFPSGNLPSVFSRYAEKVGALGYSADTTSEGKIYTKWTNEVSTVPLTLYFEDDVSCTLAKIRFPQFVKIPDEV